MNRWSLPTSATIGGVVYQIHADFRDILNIFRYLDDPDRPEYIRWRIAIALFYEGEIPQEYRHDVDSTIQCMGNEDFEKVAFYLDRMLKDME